MAGFKFGKLSLAHVFSHKLYLSINDGTWDGHESEEGKIGEQFEAFWYDDTV